MSASSWYYEPVSYVYNKGLMVGTSETLFSPTADTTRGQIALVLMRMANGMAPEEAVSFPDVASRAYYAEAVSWAAANQLMIGYSNGLFGPEDIITREQLATVLYRYAKFAGYNTSKRRDLVEFNDVDEISGFALEAMYWTVGTDIILGNAAQELLPQGKASRAELATMLMRFDQNVVTASASTELM